MKKLKLFSLLGVIVVIGLYSCSKGATGATGPKGAAGPDSVFSSAWIPADFVGEVVDAQGDSQYVQSINVPNLTEGILDSGLIISYLDQLVQNPSGTGTIDDVEPLNPSDQEIYEDYGVGIVQYTTYAWNSGGAGPYWNGNGSLRFVLIPGSTLSTNSFQGLSKAQIRTMSYSKIISILGNSGVTIKSN